MSLQVRYCEGCGRAWPAAPRGWGEVKKAGVCDGCGRATTTRDAITVIHNLHKRLDGERYGNG